MSDDEDNQNFVQYLTPPRIPGIDLEPPHVPENVEDFIVTLPDDDFRGNRVCKGKELNEARLAMARKEILEQSTRVSPSYSHAWGILKCHLTKVDIPKCKCLDRTAKFKTTKKDGPKERLGWGWGYISPETEAFPFY
jgi:hypothetical protein